VGSFQEYPDEICLKVPVGAAEEDLIFEYLNLLVSRPEVAGELGARARDYVSRECSWEAVARRYAEFLEAVAEGREYRPKAEEETPPLARAEVEEPALTNDWQAEAPAPPSATYIETWATEPQGHRYFETHHTRLAKTLEMIPPGGPSTRILEMGAYMQITPALRYKLGYGEVRGCYYGPAGRVDQRVATSETGETFECFIDHFDAEKDCFPYPDGHYDTVLCCELIEHLGADPMHMMAEIHRILKPGGRLLLTTPNAVSLRAIGAILQGYHPGFFTAYIRPSARGETEARHNREYAPGEIRALLENSGFTVERLESGEFREEPHPEFGWVRHLLRHYKLETELRGDGLFALGRKTGLVKERYPSWLYA
jgi:SAM-dependent methyltransferase